MKKLLILLLTIACLIPFNLSAMAYDQPVTAVITQEMLDDLEDGPVVIATDTFSVYPDDATARETGMVQIQLRMSLYSFNEVSYQVWATSSNVACKFKEGTGFASINVNGDDEVIDREFGANPLLDVLTLQFGDIYRCDNDFHAGDVVTVNLSGHVLTNKFGTYSFDRTLLSTYKG